MKVLVDRKVHQEPIGKLFVYIDFGKCVMVGKDICIKNHNESVVSLRTGKNLKVGMEDYVVPVNAVVSVF